MSNQIILVHGLGRTRFDMMFLEKHLKKAFPDSKVYRYGYKSRKSNLNNIVDELKDFVRSIQNDGEISFVGHSLGGVIVRALDLEWPDELKFKRLVTIGTPNNSPSIARFLTKYSVPNYIFGPVLKDIAGLNLAPKSRSLEIGLIVGKTNTRFGYLPFLGEDNDGIVTVKEALLECATDIAYVKTLHGLMPFSKVVINLVIKYLQNGAF